MRNLLKTLLYKLVPLKVCVFYNKRIKEQYNQDLKIIGGIKFDDYIQEQQKKMNKTTHNLQKTLQLKKDKFTRNRKDYKFQIHLSELEWVVPILQDL